MTKKAASKAARALRAIPSKKRSEASRKNGRKGGRPRVYEPKLIPLFLLPVTVNGLRIYAPKKRFGTLPEENIIRYRRTNGIWSLCELMDGTEISMKATTIVRVVKRGDDSTYSFPEKQDMNI